MARLHMSVVKASAAQLVIGHLMRWSILAQPAHERALGYDILCLHPDPQQAVQPIRLHIRPEYWVAEHSPVDSIRIAFRTLPKFDYLVVASLNIHLSDGAMPYTRGAAPPEFYTLPTAFLHAHCEVDQEDPDIGLVRTGKLDLSLYKDNSGWNLIAQDLGLMDAVLDSNHSDKPKEVAS